MTRDPWVRILRILRIPDPRTGLDVHSEPHGPALLARAGGQTGHYGQNPRSILGDFRVTARMRRYDVPSDVVTR